MAAAALIAMSARARGAESAEPVQKTQAQPQPWVTISLKSLGVPSIPTSFIEVGASMLTVDVVDDTHLLVTFSTRGLVPRLPGDPPDDEDRMVAAELVELPTGNVVAKTQWHMHDHSRYLWPLGKGRFLVRSRHDLFLLTPESRLKTDDPLRRIEFPVREGTPLTAIVSPEKSIFVLETMAPTKKAKVEAASTGVLVNEPKPKVMLDFFRIAGGEAPGSPVKVSGAGAVQAPGPIVLPMDGDGYLWPGDPQRGRWPVSFNEFGGREVKVGGVDSNCEPRLQMVSRFEFLAFTCMATGERTRMKSYGMDGHETWEESLGGTFGAPEFAFAPEAGRFALSRITSPGGDTDSLAFGSVLPGSATQEVRVYQTESGDLLLKLATTPVTRYAENFDLSEDGSEVAVIRDGAVEVYKLPEPSKQDLKDLEEARSFCPPVSDKPVRFAKLEAAQGSGPDDVASAELPVESAGGASGAAASAGGDSGGAGGGSAALKAPDEGGAGPDGGSAAVAGDVAKAAATKPDLGSGADGAASAAVRSGDPAASAVGDSVGDSVAGGRHGPPTLLRPGENVEKVKGSGQASAQPPR